MGWWFEVVVDDDVDDVEADELRLRQVVLNLLTNAVKFTPDGGRIVLGATRVGDEVEITVADTGVGIPQRTMSGSSTRSSRASAPWAVGGNRPGLTLTRRIVAAARRSPVAGKRGGPRQHVQLHDAVPGSAASRTTGSHHRRRGEHAPGAGRGGRPSVG